MAKKRNQIIQEVVTYIPQAEAERHQVLIINKCDLAVESISLRHNFTYLRATTPATHDITADEYYVDEADFSFTNLKEILFLQWIKSATGENAEIKFLPFQTFQKRYPYVEYSGNTDGKPAYYTKYGNRLHFNCQLDETVTARAFYQQTHGDFANNDTAHSFQPDNIGFQAIVAFVLSELRESIPGLDVGATALAAIAKKDMWVSKLIEHDLINDHEEIEIEPMDKVVFSGGVTNPYEWV